MARKRLLSGALGTKSRTVLILLVLLVLAPRPTVGAETSPVVLEIIPSTIQMAPGQERQALIVVRNSTSAELLDMRLSWFSDLPVILTGDTFQASKLEAGGSLSWRLHVALSDDVPDGGQVHFELDYLLQGADGSLPVPEVSVEALQIELTARQQVDQVAALDIQTALSLLQERQPQDIYVVVTNKTDVPICVENIEAQKPDFVTLEVPNPGACVTVAPQEAQVLAVTAKISDSVRAGKHLVLFETDLAWEKDGVQQSGTLISSHEFQVGILGESAILELLGIPSFLVLPGFLLVTMFMLLWTRLIPKKEPFLKHTTPEFWLIAISLSLIAAPLYPLITGYFGARRDYLVSYGTLDIFQVWVGSVLVAIFAWGLWVGGNKLAQYIQIRRNVLTRRDSPLIALRKMANNGVAFRLHEAELVSDAHAERPFVIQDIGDEVWVAPPITLDWHGQGPDDREDLEKAVVAAEEGPSGSPAALARVLQEYGKSVTADWKKGGPVQGPEKKVKDKEVKVVDPTVRNLCEWKEA